MIKVSRACYVVARTMKQLILLYDRQPYFYDAIQ